jgi:acyl-CoA thioester hydrolase
VKGDALPTRADYGRYLRIQTRWADNDVYGHVNNVVYYAYFDTIINRVLVGGGLDPIEGDVIGLCVESGCRYVAPARYPEELDAGLRVAKLGRTSVRYEVGIFRADEDALCAYGHFVHVFVERATRRPTPLPEGIRAALAGLVREG